MFKDGDTGCVHPVLMRAKRDLQLLLTVLQMAALIVTAEKKQMADENQK